MVYVVRKFSNLMDAWDYCNHLKKVKNKLNRPVILERKRNGKVKSITVTVILKKRT